MTEKTQTTKRWFTALGTRRLPLFTIGRKGIEMQRFTTTNTPGYSEQQLTWANKMYSEAIRFYDEASAFYEAKCETIAKKALAAVLHV